MLAFEVLVNGKRLCIAGTGQMDVVSAAISWARREADTINFHVGGIAAGDQGEHLSWNTPTIGIGDEVTIRLVDANTSDGPDETYRPAEN
jgi:hypothetical protein